MGNIISFILSKEYSSLDSLNEDLVKMQTVNYVDINVVNIVPSQPDKIFVYFSIKTTKSQLGIDYNFYLDELGLSLKRAP